MRIRVLASAPFLLCVLVANTACTAGQGGSQVSDVPAFESSTCDDLGGELGERLDGSLLTLIDGASDSGGESLSVRARATAIAHFHALNDRLQALDMRDDCDAESIFSQAEDEFSPRLRREVGGTLWDPDPSSPDETWTYEEWREFALTNLGIIDE